LSSKRSRTIKKLRRKSTVLTKSRAELTNSYENHKRKPIWENKGNKSERANWMAKKTL
jgi:hypothetical protein